MLNLPDVTIISQLYESANSLVYKAIRQEDNQPLILKVLKENYPTPTELARYRTEYEITQSLNLPGVIKAYNLQKYQNTLVMFLEDFGGKSLKLWIEKHALTLKEFLKIALCVAETLGHIHAKNIIHKDINPSNIIFNPTTGQVKIIDFGISTQLTQENTSLKNPNILEGTLAYVSPEQTGRMNCSLDYRTDFYSLGVTFYELLTYQLPFETTDALELVHCHIAKQPLDPSKINSDIPQVVSDMVMKLMAKTAEKRYQSAFGIKSDLEKCLNQLQDSGTISNFVLATQDISDKFQLPQKLYGREQEIEQLLTVFARVRYQRQMILIAGYSGVGKTALVQEIYKPITEKRGYFISGKFDQYQRDIPYSAVVSAFQSLVKQLLTESEVELRQWREKLLTALGVNGQVIIEVIPEIELIIGKQPPINRLNANQSQNRFNLVFQNFIQVFTQPEHPLVLFIDDLQWADGASLSLIQVLMRVNSPGLFFIGAYRDQEVTPAHPLMLTLDKITQQGIIIDHIYLSALDESNTVKFIADLINCDQESVRELANLVHLKTGGNPFFMNEFLKSLYMEGLLSFDYRDLKWQWNLEQIKSRNFTDNVVEFMTEKIKSLPESTQNILTLSACIGNQFDLETLALITQKEIETIIGDLYGAMAENLVTPIVNMIDIELVLAKKQFLPKSLEIREIKSVTYQFNHDRIQQAAYGLIEDSKKYYFHQKIGQLILKNTTLEGRDEKIFDIVNQLNFSIPLISDSLEKQELAELNLIAAKKAKLSAAYQPALNYLQTGIKLLTTDSWETQYQLTLSLYEESAEIAYLNTDFTLMETWIEMVLSQAKTVLDQVKVYEIKIMSYNAQGKFKEAIKTGLEVLNLLGIKLSKNPGNLDILWGLLRTKLTLGFRPINSLIDLPIMTNSSAQAAMRILSKISSTTYMFAPLMLPLVVFEQVNLSIKWGNTSESPFSAYSGYGTILCGIFGDINAGYQFGQLAIALVSKLNAKEVKCRTEFTVNNFIIHWKEPVKNILTPLQNAYLLGLETGDLEFASYATYAYICCAFLSGFALPQLELEVATYSQAVRQLRQDRSADLNCILHQAMLNLMGESEAPHDLIGQSFDEQTAIPIFYDRNDRNAIYFIYFFKFVLCFLFGELEQAISNAKVIEDYSDGAFSLLKISHFNFYNSLVHLGLYQSKSGFKQSYLRIKNNQKKLKKFADYAPQNNLHKYLLVEAELCRVLGKDYSAMGYYDQAITLAKENEYIHEVAIAYELAAKFYLGKDKEIIAKAYMQEARYYYQLWGATAKVKQLQTQYPDLLTVTQRDVSSSQITTTSSGSNLDIATVLKASQAISSEIELEQLLSRLMKILIENAGAQRGYLILSNQGKLFIEAEGTLDHEAVTVLQSIPVENCLEISQAVVNYVARTQESVVLNHAAQNGQFQNDAYIKNYQPQSILCVPLINQGQLISIVYLENNLTTEAFTTERQELLNLLSAQVAISVENAQLYKNMAQLNQAYERFVPSQFLEFLDKSSIVDVKLGDNVQLEMSVLFSDIRDFTSLSESMTPEENFKFINSYLSQMEPAIIENQGFIDKYIGDAIMALFSGDADNALKAGISMLKRLDKYNIKRLQNHYPPLKIGIGINTGSLMLGTVGGQNRMDGTVISDAVNLASRVEGLTKNYQVSLLITEQTYCRLKNPLDYYIRTIDIVKVKGKSEAVTVYEVFDGDSPDVKEGKLGTLPLFTEALELYSQGKLAEAGQLFAECWHRNQGDCVAKIYQKSCQELI
ncbi:AAA family ATPase [Planktothrix paucivesiculata]|uniref:Adenylate/guanylate cyclase with GAF sensor(S) n=1 Tax=Planktothrix paucivesiculata PCC 9631 TaxID=671071 RepID=A0A7Z9BFE5_9CYAN|nr:AAA family ATPase [Planktothrix paucivesiculata]VXD11523.1 Adenylate/guanylate cyclase with GAF sensor(S) [Planktothrix paucivesiculata PCC 9631]